ncbi:helix-turn-helix transcriptional regulator [Sphingobacterium tabacisoli]|uniref:Helix-turn-helix transcriptional regulator n=1 Tax=Sphingobacterium tabacisoli TaxID=2044855 RepID=A0ABW5KZY1_9SPHI|nr:helix-turn-helix transcriptional regulator [Sphingobacterium tabacisoli]
MRKSAFFKTVLEFGPALAPHQVGKLAPTMRINDSEITYRSRPGRSCIEQEFKGFLGYIQYYEILIDSDITIPLEIRQRDIYGLYSLRVKGRMHLCDQYGKRITAFKDRRALYQYLPPTEYYLHLTAGKYQFLCFYFDIGIFDGGADESFDFLKDLLDAQRTAAVVPRTTNDFWIGPVTEYTIELLFANLKRSDLDSQVFIIHTMKELVKLALKKINEDRDGTTHRARIANAAKILIAGYVEEYGIKCHLERIADKLAISVNYLHIVFKGETDTTPLQYINEMVLIRVKNMLDERQSIRNVSEKCGFAELSGFYRFFKRKTGMTPKEYQNR